MESIVIFTSIIESGPIEFCLFFFLIVLVFYYKYAYP